MTHRWDNPYFSDLVIHTLHRIAKKQTLSLEITTKIVDSWNWDWFCISKMYEYFNNDVELIISKDQVDWISKWCYSNLNKVDFKTALVTQTNQKSSASWLAIYMWYFLRKFDLKYPTFVLLDMLSFDWVEKNQMFGIKYLEQRLNKVDMTSRILQNLKKNIQNNSVLKNHIDYCRINKLEEVLPIALHVITNTDIDSEVRSIALDTVCELSDTISDLEIILEKIKDDFKWIVVDKLTKLKSKYTHNFLLEILTKGNETEQLKAAKYLIYFQDMKGLSYYVEWVKKKNQREIISTLFS